MKKENPIEILNEILLRMNYDLSKTLTENKVLNEQMSDYYYDQFGNLKTEPYNTTKMPAKDLYPNVTNGQYPKTIPSNDYNKRQALNTWYATAGLRKVAQQTPKPQTKQYMVSPVNYVPTSTTPAGREKELKWYTAKYFNNSNPNNPVYPDPGPIKNFDELAKQEVSGRKSTPEPLTDVNDIKEFQDFLDLWYDNWLDINGVKSDLNKDISKGYGTFGPNSKRMWDNPEVQKKWKQHKLLQYQNKQIKDIKLATSSDYLGKGYQVSPGITYGDLVDPNSKKLELVNAAKERKAAQEKEFGNIRKGGRSKITVGIGNASWDLQIPESSTLYYWTYEDHNYFEKFKNSVTFKSGSAEDWKSFLFPFGDLVGTDGKFYGSTPWKDYNMPVGKIKGFSFKSATQTWTFKQSLNSEEFLEEFGAIINGKYLKYSWTDFLEKTTWEEIGPDLLNWGSVILAVLGRPIWPLLLVSAGMDLYAAKMQAEQGDTAGAKLSALLAFTPFVGKLVVRVPTKTAQNLSRIFANAQTEQDVLNIVNTLSKEELAALKTLKELGDINTITKAAQNPEVKQAIKTSAKSITGVKTPLAGFKGRAGFELATAGATLKLMWPELKKGAQEAANRLQIINSTFITLSKSGIFTEEESKVLETEIVERKTENSLEFLNSEINKKKKILSDKKNQINSEIQSEESKGIDKANQSIIDNLEQYSKLIDEGMKLVDGTQGLINKDNSIVKTKEDDKNLQNLDSSGSEQTSSGQTSTTQTPTPSTQNTSTPTPSTSSTQNTTPKGIGGGRPSKK